MIEISAAQLEQSLRDENPWWDDLTGVAPYYRDKRPRAFLAEFMELIQAETPRREVVLLGPRRVGKTFLIHHAIQCLLDSGVAAGRILYVQIDSPVSMGMSLVEILEHYRLATGIDWKTKACHVFFDEIQYLANWETHLKSLHDAGTKTRFVVSGSANASLGKGSRESGAGRFTDFLLPPLTFAEFLQLRDRDGELLGHDHNGWWSPDIEALNTEFLQYLNFGGYPEVALTESTRRNAVRFMRSDIIDKVLLRDLPSLHGISDVRELYRLFTMLALNTGNEISLDTLSKNSAVSKETLKRYMEYLEDAFLIKIIYRVDQHAGRFKRDYAYKVMLTNPSLRTGLFGPVEEKTSELGNVVETALFAQRFHRLGEHLHYARWKSGTKDLELDLVALDSGLRPKEALEVKYTDRIVRQPKEWEPWIGFCQKNNLNRLTVTTRTLDSTVTTGGVAIYFEPTAIHAYRTGLSEETYD